MLVVAGWGADAAQIGQSAFPPWGLSGKQLTQEVWEMGVSGVTCDRRYWLTRGDGGSGGGREVEEEKEERGGE